MQDNNAQRKPKWRLNVFDIIIICAALLAALLVYKLSDTGSVVNLSGTPETIRYTIELVFMGADAAYTVKPGDALTDRVERRALGTIKSVEVNKHEPLVVNGLTGERYFVEGVEDRRTVLVVIETEANVTDREISVNGFPVRVGTEISVIGPLYAGYGYILDIERNDA